MAYTRSWSDLITLAGRYSKGLPLSTVDAALCDMVSSDMYIEYPWKDQIQTTELAPGLLPLVNGVQDYSVVTPNLDRLLSAQIWNTTNTPNDVRTINVVNDLQTDLYPRSYTTIRSVCLKEGLGQIRLEAAVNVPTGMTIELRYDYKVDPIKVSALTQDMWFKDAYAFVALEGLLYWVYKLGDDSRAGGAVTDASGRVEQYTGQLANYKAALNRMKNAEDWSTTEQVFPGDTMGLGRDQNALNIFGP